MEQKKAHITGRRHGLSAGLIGAMASCAISLSASDAMSVRPTLFVSILVEGLDANCVDLLRDSFGKGGFSRLLSEGVSAESVDYGYGSDAAAATAILMTGTSPDVNGIPAATVFDRASRRPLDILKDESALGNFTEQTLSPKAIAVSTISDELRVDGAGASKVRTIAADAAPAILMAAHAGSSAFWIDDRSGKWASSTYYRDMPQTMSRRNYSAPLSSRLDTMRWTPGYVSSTSLIPASKLKYPFSYTFPAKEVSRIDAFKSSPLANREITDVAIEYLSSTTGEATDMIGICYNLSPYPYARTSDSRHELYDSYLRLDADLSRLLTAIDAASGPGRSVVMLAGIPATSSVRRDDEQWRIPWGTFSPRKAISLLNMYLMAIYGNGEWVTGYHDRQFFLNKDLIDSKSVDMKAIRTDAATFLSKMSGISRAEAIDDIFDSGRRRMINRQHAADIYIDVTPGWEIEPLTQQTDGRQRQRGVERASYGPMPLYLLAPRLSGRRLEGSVDARRIAPTVARLLRIRSPGGASEPPLSL